MSLKRLLMATAVGAAALAVAHSTPPPSAGAQPGIVTRLRYSVGSVGATLVAGTVRRSVLQTEQTLVDMHKAIKEAKGSDGMRARDVARKIQFADSVAVESLYQGRPIQAVRRSMEAKSLLNSVRTNLKQQI